ncbi:MAG: bifunctional phosphoribosyl-AMP cyclohydrolase/phosphoribosyl-ATP diphosphatase HisIE [Saprospiraceae bacterium]|jgi:phosphoribosyl-ATP pyrophosphohydrolase/phosphoribosyl-AMP cyclohydrolase
MKISAIQPDFKKMQDSIPAVIQHSVTKQVLMLGYISKASLDHTLKSGQVTFFSRSKQQLWTKGETSGNYLQLVNIHLDCDKDALLIEALPKGPICHTGSFSCFGPKQPDLNFLQKLEAIIKARKNESQEKSYTASLFAKGINKIAQKVGEEAVELVIEAKDNDRDLFLNEAADLMYHYLVLLSAKDFSLQDVLQVLEDRHAK